MGWRSGICVAIGGGEDTCGIEDQTWRRKSDREVSAWMLCSSCYSQLRYHEISSDLRSRSPLSQGTISCLSCLSFQ